MTLDKIIIIDFGSQYTKLIARKVRECRVYSEIVSCFSDLSYLKSDKSIRGIILSGGPSSVYLKDAPLLSKQILRPGDWTVKNPDVHPGGWCFEFANDPFPDVDDSAMVVLALSRVRTGEPGRQRTAMRRGVDWILSMQNDDGGWASFDKNNNKTLLTQVPYADHNAMLDGSCADITGRVLEMLGALGYDAQFLPALRAIQYLRQQQESDGCWYGRWGVNYIYGTCFALRGLASIGVDMREGFCMRAAEWLRSCQNPDGGWGESCDSYDNPDLRGLGPSTAAQTAWALLGLFATGDYESESVRRGNCLKSRHTHSDNKDLCRCDSSRRSEHQWKHFRELLST